MDDTPEFTGVATRRISWARNSAAYRLSRRMLSEQQLREQIIRKARQKFEEIGDEECSLLAEAAIAYGRQLGALNDKNFAEVKLRSQARQGKSSRAIAHGLRSKGIEAAIVESAMQDADDVSAAIILARKRGYGPFDRHGDRLEQRARQLAAFARNGFSFDLARRVLDMSREEAEAELETGGEW
ncbi:regulatory protein RecX [Allorhizobium undicola]|uniref:regulatory protein RecX n=1 Tax=Allorhizobium undicola TaxID=78527 RepID=UPI003D34AE66